MSNARSPRDVCSTTIGTRGLIVLALFRFLGSNPARAECFPAPDRWGESSNRLVAVWRVRTPAGARAIRRSGSSGGGSGSASGSGSRSASGDASVRSSGGRSGSSSRRSRRSSLARGAVGHPQSLARGRLLGRDRLRPLGEQVHRLARGDVLAQRVERAGFAHALKQLLGSRALALGGRGERLGELLIGRLDRLGGDDGGEYGLALERAFGVGLGLVE